MNNIREQDKAGDADFQTELTELINKFSKENGSNTPDFILSRYLCDCLRAFDATTVERDMGRTINQPAKWHRADEPPIEGLLVLTAAKAKTKTGWRMAVSYVGGGTWWYADNLGKSMWPRPLLWTCLSPPEDKYKKTAREVQNKRDEVKYMPPYGPNDWD